MGLKKILKLCCVFLVVFLLQNKLSSQEDIKPIELEIILGIDKTIKLDFTPSTKTQVGNDSVITHEIIPQKREITFKGKKPGNSSFTIRNTVGDIKAKYLIRVVANDQSKIVSELKAHLGDIEGLEIGIKGKSVYVGGNIIVPNDIGRIAMILQKYPTVIPLVELSPQTQRVIARKMQDEIAKANMKDVTVRVLNKLFVLDGVVKSDGARVRAEKIAAIYVPDRIKSLATQTGAADIAQKNIIQNFIQVNKKSKPPPIPKMVKINAQFVELTKDYNKIFGFKWQPLISDGQGTISFGKTNSGSVTTGSRDTLAGTISNLLPKLSSAKAAGFARIIQSGVIVVKDKVRGTINKKESKPFALGTNEFTKSEKAEAGFDLAVTPTILQEEKIELNIGLTVSANTGTPPTTLSNSISTSIVIKSDESAVAGGIVVNKNSTDFDKQPPGSIDEFEGASPLFSFVRSRNYAVTKSQFVVFVTPKILESASEGTADTKRKFRKRRR